MDKKNSTSSLHQIYQTLVWLFRLIYKFCPQLFVAIFFLQLLITVTPFVEQRLLSSLIDSILASINTSANSWISVFIIFISVRFFTTTLRNIYKVFQRIFNYRLQNNLRKFYLTRTSLLDYQQFEDPELSNLISKVREEYDWRIRQFVTDSLELFVQLFSFITVIYLLMPHYWFIAILLFIGELPGVIYSKKWQQKDWAIFNHYHDIGRPSWDAAWQLTSKQFIAELKINQAVSWLKKKFTYIQDEFTNALINSRRQKLLPDIAADTFSQLINIFCLVFIVNDIKNGALSIGMFTFYFGIIRSTGDYFSGLLNHIISLGEQSPHIQNFRKVVECQPAIINGQISSGLPSLPRIEFRNVSFRYPNNHKWIYRHLNLTINPGEEVAIVGPNGAGKSTLVKLICRFYDPIEGDILINNIPLKNIDINYWYKQLSLLTQEFNVYPNLTLRDNISVGQPVSDKQIIESLKKAEAHSFTSKYKQGLDTMMSQKYHGVEPSWGQWQKIAIARTFNQNAPVIILDEPTASIDAIAESKIFGRLYKQIKKKTLIIISHRFSTVRNAQRIIVIDKGKIIEEGTHDFLLKKNGLYAKSFTLQAKGYN